MKEWFMVAIGGMLGSLLRHGIHQGSLVLLGSKFPFGTLIANGIGCFCIGFGWHVAERQGWIGGQWELAYRAGLLGGLTTFSAFSLDIVRFWQQGEYGLGALVLLGNLLLGVVGVLLGMMLASSLYPS